MLNATLKTYEDLFQAGGKKPDLILGPWSHNGYLASQAGVERFILSRIGTGTENSANTILSENKEIAFI